MSTSIYLMPNDVLTLVTDYPVLVKYKTKPTLELFSKIEAQTIHGLREELAICRAYASKLESQLEKYEEDFGEGW